MASDFINTYRGVDQTKTQAFEFLNNRARVRTTKGKRGDSEPVMDNTFTRPIPKTVSRQQFYGSEGIKDREITLGYDEDGRRRIHVLTDKELAEAEEKLLKVWLPTPRKKAEDKAKEVGTSRSLYSIWHGKRTGWGIVEYHCCVLKQWEGYKLLMFFAGTEFILVQEASETRWVSMTYRSRDEALSHAKNKSISWIVQEPI